MKTIPLDIAKKQALNTQLKSHWNWLFICGFALIILSLGLFADQFLVLKTGMLSSLSLMVVAIMLFTHSIIFWKKRIIGQILHILNAIAYLFFSFALILNINLLNDDAHILFASILFLTGIFRIYTSFQQGVFSLNWYWTLVLGLINLFLFLILVMIHPSIKLLMLSSSIDIILHGISLVALGSAGKILSMK